MEIEKPEEKKQVLPPPNTLPTPFPSPKTLSLKLRISTKE